MAGFFIFNFNVGADPKSVVQLLVAGHSQANWYPGNTELVDYLFY